MERSKDKAPDTQRTLMFASAMASVMAVAMAAYAYLCPQSLADATQHDTGAPSHVASVTDAADSVVPFARTDWQESPEMTAARGLLIEGMLSVDESIDVSSAHLKSDLLSDTYHAILDEDPRMWHARGTCSYVVGGDGIVLSVQPDYVSTDMAEIERTHIEYEQAMDELLSGVSDGMSDMTKVKAIHDGIISRCSYNKACSDNPAGYEVTLRNNPYGAHSAMMTGLTVCRGYSLAFKDACTRIGIPCKTVRTEEHEWDKVLVGGHWYNIDLTFDDSEDSQIHKYEIFMKSDAYLAEYDAESGDMLHAGAYPTDIPADDTTYDNPTALLAAMM